MKFASKTYMAQELLAGKRFINKQGDTIYYDVFGLSSKSPFRVSKYDQLATAEPMEGEWDAFNQDIWDEVKPRRVHQDLIDMYEEGQAWQAYNKVTGEWYALRNSNTWLRPAWDANTQYRLHPHNELIQAHRNGAKIQLQTFRGDWVDTDNPDWDENVKYRIKTSTKTVYEWMFYSQNRSRWLVDGQLLSDDEAKLYYEVETVKYRKTGRSWEVEV